MIFVFGYVCEIPLSSAGRFSSVYDHGDCECRSESLSFVLVFMILFTPGAYSSFILVRVRTGGRTRVQVRAGVSVIWG